MLKNYLKVALRNLVKQKSYSIITIIGLSVGITCCLLIMLYVKQELSYDKFFPRSDRIFRVAHQVTTPQAVTSGAATPAPLAPALKEEYPEIQYITRMYFENALLFEIGSKRIFEDNLIFADPEFFKVFPFRILMGDPSHLLDSPDSLVLTASMAKKYFADENPIGKTIRVDKQYNFIIAGVMQDIPINSHYHFDFVASFLAKNEENFGTWMNLWTGITTLYTYAVLPENLNIEEFAHKAENIITRHSEPRLGIERKIFLQPLKSIHLHSHIEDEIEENNYVSRLIILSTIAFLILIVACINYMNLATSQSAKRAKEVGMRKVMGAGRFQLAKQFMGESIFLTLLAMFISILWVELFLPAFSSFVGKPVSLSFGENILFLSGFMFLSLLVGAISSIYPALILSRHLPIRTLKGLKDSPKGSAGQVIFKKALLVFQFVVSILLIASTIIIVQQLHYMKNAHLGFDKESTIVIPLLDEPVQKRYEAMKHELLTHPDVTGVTGCLKSPIGNNVMITRAFPKGREAGVSFTVYLNFVDYDYIRNFEIEMVAGRNFSKEYSTDSKDAFIVNEATVRKWGMSSPEEAVGEKLLTGFYGLEGTVIGVAKDYHIASFHQEIEAQILIHNPEIFWEMALKIRSKDMSNTLAFIERAWNEFAPEYPFTYSFLDESIDRLYDGEEQTARIIRTFSIIAIAIACLGLFGLAAFAAERRTKELGIRKVLGASVSNLIFMLSSEFTKWVLLSNILAWPLAYFAMRRWLQSFAYRINIEIWPFILAAAFALVIALFTVSYQAVRAALTNPVETLRYE